MRVSAVALLLIAAPSAFAQGWQPPRNAFGAPDLQGVWNNMTATPLERPAAFAQLTTTEDRAAAFATSSQDAFRNDESDGVNGRQSEWWELTGDMLRIGGEIRTSVVVDPPNGRMPYSDAGRAELTRRQQANLNAFDDPEARPSPERCLTGGSGASGAPFFPARYNTNYRIVQTRDHLLIQIEQGNTARIIPFAAARQRTALRKWFGESIGRWEGDTLVVETRNFHLGDAFKPAAPIYISANAIVTERFTRISPGEILYRYTVEDPDAFSQTWTGETLLYATQNPIYEYACHEGNYAVANALKGGRTADARAAGVKR
jgi:hypothetical protein